MKIIITYQLKNISLLSEENKIEEVKSFSLAKSDIITRKIINLLESKVSNLATLPGYNVLRFNLNEIINNCLDSIAEKRLSSSSYSQAEIKIIVKETENSLSIKIKDNGLGLGADFLKKITYSEFEANKSHIHFKKASSKFNIGGNGIGLFNLNKQLKNQKADLYMKSRKNGGATIEICLNN